MATAHLGVVATAPQAAKGGFMPQMMFSAEWAVPIFYKIKAVTKMETSLKWHPTDQLPAEPSYFSEL